MYFYKKSIVKSYQNPPTEEQVMFPDCEKALIYYLQLLVDMKH